MKALDDQDCWEAYPQYRWVFDRLELCTRLGYRCGPAGLPFPSSTSPREWFCKPQINLRGMGCGAFKVKHPDEVPPGYIWMPYFVGEHLSIDYDRGSHNNWFPSLVVKCIYDQGRPAVWKRMKLSKDIPELPPLFGRINTSHLNVEYIGEYVIEAHLRQNPDFIDHDRDVVIPIWEDYHRDPDNGDGWLKKPRLGFIRLTQDIIDQLS